MMPRPSSWYREAAAQGHTLAQLTLGLMYAAGLGVPQMMTLKRVSGSAKLLNRATPTRQFNLGDLYRDGRGVPQDDAEAVAWYRRAVEQGHTDAQAADRTNALPSRNSYGQQVTSTQASDPASCFRLKVLSANGGRERS